MKKLLLSVALITSVHAESGKNGPAKSSFPEFKTSYFFLDLGLGGRVGHSNPYLQGCSCPPCMMGSSSTLISESPSKKLIEAKRLTCNAFVVSLGGGGDYIFSSSCLVLGGYFRYAFSNASNRRIGLYVESPQSGINFTTNNFGNQLQSRNFLSFGTRLGVRSNRHLFVGIIGMSFPSFSGSVWGVNQGGFTERVVRFKTRFLPFIQLGGEYAYSFTQKFAMALSYTFNLGRVRLSKMKSAGSGYNAFVANIISNSGAIYRARRLSFSEILAIFRYMMPTSR